MSFWSRFAEYVAELSSSALTAVVETVRTMFEGDPETRRRVAFSIAMIALSAKMAKADGIVLPSEVQAFQQIFTIPEAEFKNVSRLYNIAKEDVAGFEAYAEQLAKLYGNDDDDPLILEDILDGLFHIAKADHLLHQKELDFLETIAVIFELNEDHYAQILARHTDLGAKDPHRILGVPETADFTTVKAAYRDLLRQNHPDVLIARGLPEDFIAIANERVAAINEAYAVLRKRHERAEAV